MTSEAADTLTGSQEVGPRVMESRRNLVIWMHDKEYVLRVSFVPKARKVIGWTIAYWETMYPLLYTSGFPIIDIF